MNRIQSGTGRVRSSFDKVMTYDATSLVDSETYPENSENYGNAALNRKVS